MLAACLWHGQYTHTAIVDGQSQADPQFRTNRLYTRLTAAEVRRQLIAQKGYREDELPTAETISTKLNELGYYPKTVVARVTLTETKAEDNEFRA